MFSVSKACHVCPPFSGLIDVFSDIVGTLESENTVEVSIPDPPFSWFRMNPPNFIREEGGEIREKRDWRAPILGLWDTGTHIHIRNNENN